MLVCLFVCLFVCIADSHTVWHRDRDWLKNVYWVGCPREFTFYSFAVKGTKAPYWEGNSVALILAHPVSKGKRIKRIGILTRLKITSGITRVHKALSICTTRRRTTKHNLDPRWTYVTTRVKTEFSTADFFERWIEKYPDHVKKIMMATFCASQY
jgi:hypothetical protein